jgi:polysaccharide pyruvyl transferase WcaK-like protein
MAKSFIHDTSIKQNKYDINIQNNINRIKPIDWVFSTRLHATIMAIKAGAKLTALTYADKNVRLLNDLNVKENQFIKLEDLLKPIEHLKSIHFISDNKLINTLSDSVSQIIENKISSLFND